MVVRINSILLWALFVIAMPCFASPIERIAFKSTSGLRSTFSAIVYRPNAFSLGTAFYIHGGGCTFTESASDVQASWTVEMLNKAGWTVVVPQYFENLPWTLDWLFNNKVMRNFCERNVNVLVRDLPLMVSQYRRATHDENIFFVGHSFGGYIVNLLATQSPRIDEVRAYISLHGIWDTLEMYEAQGTDRVVPSSVRPIDQSSENLSPILVIHSEDDGAVPFSQIATFKKWAGQASNYEIKIYPSGGHTPGLIPEGNKPIYPVTDLAQIVLDFMNKYRISDLK